MTVIPTNNTKFLKDANLSVSILIREGALVIDNLLTDIHDENGIYTFTTDISYGLMRKYCDFHVIDGIMLYGFNDTSESKILAEFKYVGGLGAFKNPKGKSIIISFNTTDQKWSIEIEDREKTKEEEDVFMKQVTIYDKENEQTHVGILLENGDVICGCCGGLIKADEIGAEHNKTHQVIDIFEHWTDLDEIIGE